MSSAVQTLFCRCRRNPRSGFASEASSLCPPHCARTSVSRTGACQSSPGLLSTICILNYWKCCSQSHQKTEDTVINSRQNVKGSTQPLPRCLSDWLGPVSQAPTQIQKIRSRSFFSFCTKYEGGKKKNCDSSSQTVMNSGSSIFNMLICKFSEMCPFCTGLLTQSLFKNTAQHVSVDQRTLKLSFKERIWFSGSKMEA